MLALRYSPSEEQNVLSEELILHNDLKEVKLLGAFVKQVAGRLNMDKHLMGKLRLAVEEAVVNVIDYAYPIGSTGDISVRAMSDGKLVKFIITDSGKAFDPTQIDKADTTLSAEDRPIGGLGIFIVREMMDSVNYERVEGQNVLTLRKRLEASGQRSEHSFEP